MRVITAPEEIDLENTDFKLYLGGSIDKKYGSPWHRNIISFISSKLGRESKLTIYNPKREEWDKDWPADSKVIDEQALWELKAMEHADLIFMFFESSCSSSVGMMQLGLNAKEGKLVVVCERHFWKKRDVDVICETYGVPRYDSIAVGIGEVRDFIMEKLKEKEEEVVL